MIKCISYYDAKNEKLVTHYLDSDACVGANEKSAVAIDISMKKLDSTDQASPKRTIYGVSRDSGGG